MQGDRLGPPAGASQTVPGGVGVPISRAMGYGLDIIEEDPTRDPSGRNGGGNRWLGVHFVCAGQYVRVYRREDQTMYRACCPRCARTVTFRVAPGGTACRFFQVQC